MYLSLHVHRRPQAFEPSDYLSKPVVRAPQHQITMAPVEFKVLGLESFALDLEPQTAVRDVKRQASEACNVEPEHMRLIYKDTVLKEDDTLDGCDVVQISFTSGADGLVGGGQVPKDRGNPFTTPVRGLPGSKGSRPSRLSGRPGGMGLIRKYGILMKRQEFREKAEEIGFRKYR